jgi:hypothetical protein
MEKQLTEKESLLIIQQMISRAKNEFVDTGIGPILWGTVIATCSLVQAAKLYFRFDLSFDIWLLALFAIVPQILISIKESKERKAKGWGDDMMGYVWICFGVGVFMINLINNVMGTELNPALDEYRQLTGKTVSSTWSYASCFLLFVFGYPTIVTGATRKIYIMLAGGIFCWASAIVAAFTATYIDFLLMAFSAIMAWLIPGIMLRRKYLAQKQANV